MKISNDPQFPDNAIESNQPELFFGTEAIDGMVHPWIGKDVGSLYIWVNGASTAIYQRRNVADVTTDWELITSTPSGSGITQTDGITSASAGQIIVDNTTGFLDLVRIVYVLIGGALEFNTVSSVDDIHTLSVSNPVGAAGIADGTFVFVASEAEYQTYQDMVQAQADIVQSQTDITQAQTDITQAQTDITQAQTDITQSQTDITQAQTDITQAQTDITTIDAAIAAAAVAIKYGNGVVPTLATAMEWAGRGIFSVRAYGATGDGTTDDTAAINAAFTACQSAGGGTVFFPPGTYIADTNLLPGNNTAIVGSGWSTIFKYRDNTPIYNGLFYINGKTNVTCRDFAIDGNEAGLLADITSISGNGTTITIYFAQDHGLNAGWPISIIGTSGYNGNYYVDTVPLSTRITVLGAGTGAEFSGQVRPAWQHGVRFRDCANVACHNLYVHDISGSHGGGWEGGGIEVTHAANSASYAIISGCLMEAIGGLAIGGYRAGYVTVTGNIVNGSRTMGISLSSDSTSAVHNTVTGNVIRDCEEAGINLEHQSYVTIVGNSTKNCGSSPTGAYRKGAIRIQAGANVTIADHVSNADVHLVLGDANVTDEPTNINISNCVAIGSKPVVGNSKGTIQIDGGGTELRWKISNCRILGSTASGIYANSNAAAVEVIGCSITGCAEYGIYIDGTEVDALEISDCRITNNTLSGIYVNGASRFVAATNYIETCGDYGIYSKATSTIITSCFIANVAVFGIDVQAQCSDAEIANCKIQTTAGGMIVRANARATITGNSVHGCTADGIKFRGTAGNAPIAAITGNVVSGSGASGILVEHATGGTTLYATISNNVCSANTTAGILINTILYVNAVGNVLSGNNWGLSHAGAADYTQIGYNIFNNNTTGTIQSLPSNSIAANNLGA